eukprot:gnl/Dysnectes_brevis/2217_a2586_1809.p1 GENE.gnl/Dysnectes_brevis/2217_a2586_1809~~gnl/Dysnectes_brevis/2217_a2586_1809.p1  ORF type:complete len:191 (-),score=59.26 gnl/Dysnectes_brevis/2217_a2586_1809:271-843(-)
MTVHNKPILAYGVFLALLAAFLFVSSLFVTLKEYKRIDAEYTGQIYTVLMDFQNDSDNELYEVIATATWTAYGTTCFQNVSICSWERIPISEHCYDLDEHEYNLPSDYVMSEEPCEVLYYVEHATSLPIAAFMALLFGALMAGVSFIPKELIVPPTLAQGQKPPKPPTSDKPLFISSPLASREGGQPLLL